MDAERDGWVGGLNFGQFRTDVAELVLAALAKTAAHLLLNYETRGDIVGRNAHLAVKMAAPLWDALSALPRCEPEMEQVRTTAAIRCLAGVVGHFGDLATQGPENHNAIIDQSVKAAVQSAQALVKILSGDACP